MAPKDEADFSRFELMILHRLETLEELTKDGHKAFEDLRIDVATLRTTVNVRTVTIAAFISLAVAALGPLVSFFQNI